MSDAQAISALDRMLGEPLPTALIFQNGEDLFDMLDADAVRHWDNTLGDWTGARLPSTSRNLAVLLFRDEIDLSRERLPRLRKHLFGEGAERPLSDRSLRVGTARQDEVTSVLHRLRLLGEIRWTPLQISRYSLTLAQGLIPENITDGITSLGTLSHQVRAHSTPVPATADPWTQLRQTPGLAKRVEQPLRDLVRDARAKLARHGPPPRRPGTLDIARLSSPRQPAADQLANLHLALLGSPGTGKTTLARLVARLYRDEGILTSGHLVEVSASQLIEEHIGGTAKRTAEAVARALHARVDPSRITLSSDANASLPRFDAEGRFAGLEPGRLGSLFEVLGECVEAHGLPLERALGMASTHAADALGLARKGRLAEGFDADLLVLADGAWTIDEVWALGRRVHRRG